MVLGRAGTASHATPVRPPGGVGPADGDAPLAVGATKPAPAVRPTVTDDATLSDFLEAESAAADESDGDDALEEGSDSRDDGPVEPEVDEKPDSGDSAGATGAGEPTDDGSAGDDENPASAESSGDGVAAQSAADSGLSTYAWGEYTCSRCEGETERVWREDGALVCPDCKSW